MKACLKCSDRLDGQIQGERESAVKSYTHARRGGEGRAGREGWKESEEVLREETHPLCCGGRNGCFALGRSCLRLLSGLETVTVAQRCGFTRYSSGSSSFLVLVSLPEILLEAHWHPLSGWCWRGACALRQHVKYTLRCCDHFMGWILFILRNFADLQQVFKNGYYFWMYVNYRVLSCHKLREVTLEKGDIPQFSVCTVVRIAQ